MTIELYGSVTSPYVRRIRMLLEGQDYAFKQVNIYDAGERSEFSEISPIRKLPVLKVDNQVIYDSGVIADYLLRQSSAEPLSLARYNLISAINAATDSLVIIFQSKNSGLAVDEQKLFYDLQISRVKVCLGWLEQQAGQGAFDAWDYATMALVTLLDWAEFRELLPAEGCSNLLQARAAQAQRPVVVATMPGVQPQ